MTAGWWDYRRLLLWFLAEIAVADVVSLSCCSQGTSSCSCVDRRRVAQDFSRLKFPSKVQPLLSPLWLWWMGRTVQRFCWGTLPNCRNWYCSNVKSAAVGLFSGHNCLRAKTTTKNPLKEMKMFQRTEAAFKLHLHPSKSQLMSIVLVQSANYSANSTFLFFYWGLHKYMSNFVELYIWHAASRIMLTASTEWIQLPCRFKLFSHCSFLSGCCIFLFAAETQAVTAAAIKGS